MAGPVVLANGLLELHQLLLTLQQLHLQVLTQVLLLGNFLHMEEHRSEVMRRGEEGGGGGGGRGEGMGKEIREGGGRLTEATSSSSF